MPLSDLIDNPAEVLAHWPHEPLTFHRAPDTFQHLLTLDEVDELIDSNCLAMRNVVLLKQGRIFEAWEYHDPNDPGMPRRNTVRRHITDGGSISLRELEQFKPAVARLYEELRHETGYGVHINAYLTPPGAQGLKYHFDPYVTLVLQLAGRKTWPCHRPFIKAPVQEYGSFHLTGFTAEQLRYLATTPPALSFTLAPGDVLWLPRGYVHSPYTEGDETSLHITVAFKERTHQWLTQQIAEDLVQRALQDPQMREELPPTTLMGDTLSAIKQAREYLIGALLLMDPEDAVKYVRGAALRP
ncbi:cupin [Streptomyces albofaciens JCM 4342]|uniref:JmjC domain-containing protein n=1 Tax=Streptomyces albofaciens TaxID=66866 RepID=UPI000A455D23|nr:cupin domain-containing protein [Streptomyces albofaciens]KAA6220615.1 cupin [Streptomyces albofaciens JCM 4342]KAA6220658.1 cupin [Streptomyces albofaciens JCM 4342]